MRLIALSFLLFGLVGCTGLSPVNGSLFTETTAGLSGSGKMGSKRGSACMKSIVGVAIGDVSIEKAAKNGGIKTITHVEAETMSILGVYAHYCTVVYGR